MKLPFKKIEINSPVILGYAAISFIVLIFGYATLGSSTKALFTCYRTSIADPMMYLRLITHVFGHADISHYLNNFFLIMLIGPMLEEKYGSKRLIYMMLITAVVAGIVNVLISPNGLLGASGIVFMMIVLCSFTSVKSGKIPLTMIIVVIIYIGQEIITGIAVKDNISQLSHILGGLCGIGFGLYYNQHGIQKN